MPTITHSFKSQAALERSLRLWQKRLRLQDWDVSASVVRASYFGDLGQTGGCDVDIRNQKAKVQVLDVIDYDYEGDEYTYDAEGTLVHELCHLLLARITTQLGEDASDDEEEIAVNRMAGALLAAYRQ